jgi:site-specific DNA recombinase
MEYCLTNKGKLNHVIVYKVDRFARQSYDHHFLTAKLKSMGIKLVSVTEHLEDSPSGRFMESMLAAAAQHDNEVRSERAKGGMESRLMQGAWPFPAPIGFVNVRDELGRPTLKTDSQAPSVANWLREYLNQPYNAKDMHRLAPSMGVTNKSGNKLSYQMVINMLKSPTYCGLVDSKMIDGPVKGLHEPLISVEEHEEILAKLKGKRRQKSIVRSLSEEAWPLRGGFVTCATCSTPLTGSSPRGRSKSYPRYSCPLCRQRVTGSPVSIARDQLHSHFLELLETIVPTDETLQKFKSEYLKKLSNRKRDIERDLSEQAKELAKLRERKQRILDKYIDNEISKDEKDEFMDAVQLKLVTLEVKDFTQTMAYFMSDIQLDYAVQVMANLPKQWEDATAEQKRRFQNLIFPSGIAYDFKEGFRTPVLGLGYALIRDIDTDKSILVGAPGLEPGTKRL